MTNMAITTTELTVDNFFLINAREREIIALSYQLDETATINKLSLDLSSLFAMYDLQDSLRTLQLSYLGYEKLLNEFNEPIKSYSCFGDVCTSDLYDLASKLLLGNNGNKTVDDFHTMIISELVYRAKESRELNPLYFHSIVK